MRVRPPKPEKPPPRPRTETLVQRVAREWLAQKGKPNAKSAAWFAKRHGLARTSITCAAYRIQKRTPPAP